MSLYIYKISIPVGSCAHILRQLIYISLDQLREKLNLNVDELEHVSGDDLRSQVDQAIDEVRHIFCMEILMQSRFWLLNDSVYSVYKACGPYKNEGAIG